MHRSNIIEHKTTLQLHHHSNQTSYHTTETVPEAHKYNKKEKKYQNTLMEVNCLVKVMINFPKVNIMLQTLKLNEISIVELRIH